MLCAFVVCHRCFASLLSSYILHVCCTYFISCSSFWIAALLMSSRSASCNQPLSVSSSLSETCCTLMVHDARFLDHHFQPFEQVHSAPVSLDPTQSHRIPMLAVHFEGRLQFDPKARPSQLSGQLIQNLLVAPSRQGNPTQDEAPSHSRVASPACLARRSNEAELTA